MLVFGGCNSSGYWSWCRISRAKLSFWERFFFTVLFRKYMYNIHHVSCNSHNCPIFVTFLNLAKLKMQLGFYLGSRSSSSLRIKKRLINIYIYMYIYIHMPCTSEPWKKAGFRHATRVLRHLTGITRFLVEKPGFHPPHPVSLRIFKTMLRGKTYIMSYGSFLYIDHW